MNSNSDIYQLKIVVQHSKPSIWRRIQVPGTYTFYELHEAIQDVMNWSGYHLHKFQMKKKNNSETEYIGITDPITAKLVKMLPENRTRIADQFLMCIYTYNFVNEWILLISLEKTIKPKLGVQYPVVKAGQRQSPSEYQCEIEKGPDDTEFYDIHVPFRNPKDRRLDVLPTILIQSFCCK